MIDQVVSETDMSFLGYLCPTSAVKLSTRGNAEQASAVADGGSLNGLERLGGLSRITEAIAEYSVDTVVLAFAGDDRAEVFGTLDACYEHGVDVKVH
jgi:hypothetical protein